MTHIMRLAVSLVVATAILGVSTWVTSLVFLGAAGFGPGFHLPQFLLRVVVHTLLLWGVWEIGASAQRRRDQS
ncbi:hypothetical protein ACFQS2_14025 [Brachybacterium sp. GCM10030267]|uniref:hypothetical protein n=1 Tax=Brachybacterium sp. GCM10030267 TaxID=3273381 RepID=UPI00360B7011